MPLRLSIILPETSHIKQKVNYITIMDGIVLALQMEQTLLTSLSQAAALYHFLVADYLGANEASFYIGVDFTSRLKGTRAT